MLMILARLVRSESFWAVAKVRSPHTGPGIRYIIHRCGVPQQQQQVGGDTLKVAARRLQGRDRPGHV